MKKACLKLIKSKLFMRVILPIILAIIIVIIAYFSFIASNKILSKKEAMSVSENFINTSLMRNGNKATIESITDENGLYKLKVKIVNGTVESYMTKNGKLFFPNAFEMTKLDNREPNKSPAANTPSVNVPKSKTPTVDLFVMSYCPYGTQIEKGILPVLKTLGNKINFNLKFVDYSMHGQKELTENLVQYCIRQEQPNELENYLACFLTGTSSNSCLAKTKINTKKIATCVSKTDKKYSITKNSENNINYRGRYPSFNIDQKDNVKYSVAGSPTLVINGKTVRSDRDSASLLKTICASFEKAPKECSATLSTVSPSPGIGYKASSTNSGSAATCN